MEQQLSTTDRVECLQQLDRAHLHTKALHDAAEEAVKYHDKYMAALAKLTSCLLDNSDCVEEMRASLTKKTSSIEGKDSGRAIAPTYEITGATAAAFDKVKSSVPMKTLRDAFIKLAESSTIAKRHSKVARSHLEEVDVATKKYTKQLANDKQQQHPKLAQVNAKKRAKLACGLQAEETRLVKLDTGARESVRSLCAWWAETLSKHTEQLFSSFRSAGSYAAECYADVEHFSTTLSSPILGAPAAVAEMRCTTHHPAHASSPAVMEGRGSAGCDSLTATTAATTSPSAVCRDVHCTSFQPFSSEPFLRSSPSSASPSPPRPLPPPPPALYAAVRDESPHRMPIVVSDSEEDVRRTSNVVSPTFSCRHSDFR